MNMEARGGIEPPMRELQSLALPLCYLATNGFYNASVLKQGIFASIFNIPKVLVEYAGKD